VAVLLLYPEELVGEFREDAKEDQFAERPASSRNAQVFSLSSFKDIFENKHFAQVWETLVQCFKGILKLFSN